MGTLTPRGIYKPAIDETGWGALVNTNFDFLDRALTGIVYTQTYSTFSSAVAAAGGAVLVVNTAVTLDSNTTLPVGTSVVVTEAGSIAKASTYTLTIKGYFEAGPYTVFTGFDAGDVTFGDHVNFNNNKTITIWAEWFGAVGDDSTDNAVALQSWLDSFPSETGQILRLGIGIFQTSVQLSLAKHNFVLQGQPSRSTTYFGTIIKAHSTYTSNPNNQMIDFTQCDHVTILDIALNGNAGIAMGGLVLGNLNGTLTTFHKIDGLTLQGINGVNLDLGGDRTVGFDGVTDGTTAFTSVTGGFEASDVGRRIYIYNTADDSLDHDGIIAAYVSGNAITLAGTVGADTGKHFFIGGGATAHSIISRLIIENSYSTTEPNSIGVYQGGQAMRFADSTISGNHIGAQIAPSTDATFKNVMWSGGEIAWQYIGSTSAGAPANYEFDSCLTENLDKYVFIAVFDSATTFSDLTFIDTKFHATSGTATKLMDFTGLKDGQINIIGGLLGASSLATVTVPADLNIVVNASYKDDIIWTEASPGSVRNSVNTITSEVTIATADVNALETTPIQLIAAQGANTWVEFVGAMIAYNYTTTAFTDTGADNDFVIRYDGGAGTDLTPAIQATGFIDQANDEIRYAPASAWTVADDVVAVVNKKVELHNPGTGTTDGGTSTLIIKATFRIHKTGL